MATNHIDVVRRIDELYPHLLKHNNSAACGEFIQRVANESEMRNERWGLLSKNEGEAGHTFPNGIRTAYDVIALPDGQRIDIINGANGHPAPGGPSWQEIPPEHWRPHNVWVDTSSWPIYDSGTSTDSVSKVALLGRGWFCMLRMMQDWRDEFNSNLDWILKNENPDIFRIMLNVEGMMHQGGTGVDVWRDAGVDPNASWWSDRFKECLDILGNKGKKGWFTLHGGMYFLPSDSDRLAFNDRVVQTIASGNYWNAVHGIEIANEYNVNGFDDDQIKLLGRDMRAKLPAGMWLALSSPALAHGGTNDTTNEEMLESMHRIYDPSDFGGANCMTIHRSRDVSCKWSDPFIYNTLIPELPKLDNEPAGQGASAGGDVNEVDWIVGEYEDVSSANWQFYMGHNAWCVWNGHIPDEHLAYLDEEHPKHFIKDITNQPEVSAGLKQFRGGEEEMIPYDESKSIEFGLLCNDTYAESGASPDGGMVSVHTSRCMWDYYVAKMEWEECKTKHINEFRAEYSLPPI